MPAPGCQVTTSYDYDALLDEGGRRTAKFYEVKKVLQAWKAENPKMGRLGLKTMPVRSLYNLRDHLRVSCIHMPLGSLPARLMWPLCCASSGRRTGG